MVHLFGIIAREKKLLNVFGEPLLKYFFISKKTIINFISYQGKFLKASQLSYIWFLEKMFLMLVTYLAFLAFSTAEHYETDNINFRLYFVLT